MSTESEVTSWSAGGLGYAIVLGKALIDLLEAHPDGELIYRRR